MWFPKSFGEWMVYENYIQAPEKFYYIPTEEFNTPAKRKAVLLHMSEKRWVNLLDLKQAMRYALTKETRDGKRQNAQ